LQSSWAKINEASPALPALRKVRLLILSKGHSFYAHYESERTTFSFQGGRRQNPISRKFPTILIDGHAEGKSVDWQTRKNYNLFP
jgi:hypothetical protein